MTYYINDREYTFESGTSLVQILIRNNLFDEKIAVAINGEIILKKFWESKFIKEMDKIEIIRPTQGGWKKNAECRWT